MITKDMFLGAHTPMQDADYIRAANALGAEPAVIQTVTMVETNGSPFLADGRPDILFESHVFGRLTSHRYNNVTDPNGKAISANSWDRSLYGKGGAWQYVRLEKAMECDPEAACKAASWGAFQILGENYQISGYDTLEDFILAMANSAGDHLYAFVNYCKSRHLDDELRDKRWADFARVFNGAGYKQNQYDDKMAAAYRKLVGAWASKRQLLSGTSPEAVDVTADIHSDRITVAAVQAALNVFDFIDPKLKADGFAGPKTAEAVAAYCAAHGIEETDGKITDAVLNSLGVQ